MDTCEKREKSALPSKQNIFVGSEIGLLKGIDCETNKWGNLNSLSEVDRNNEIVGMFWSNQDQTEITVGRRCQQVDMYDLKEEMWGQSYQLGSADKKLKCLARLQQQIITGDTEGLVQLWKDGESQLSIQTGNNLYCLGQRSDELNIIVSGGNENDAKMWDLHHPESPVFSVKNVRGDWLGLRSRVWVRGVEFMPESNKFVTCTAYHQIRMYDPSAHKRPVMDMTYGELPIISMAMLSSGQYVIVSNTNGDTSLIDIRKRGFLKHVYRGNKGAVRCIKCHSHNSTVAVCGLDRHMRVYDIESHALLTSTYLKSRLNCLLYRDEPFERTPINNENDEETKTDENKNDIDNDDDELWDSIEQISKENKKRKTSNPRMSLRSSDKRNKSNVES